MSSASSNPSAVRRLGDFEIVRELGRGGMGVVYEARQVSLSRKVALKVLSASLGLTPQAVQRFKREAEAAARLHHTNIVPVYATGEQGGTHFYAMELIEGPSLDHVIRQARPSPTAERDGPSAELGDAEAATTPHLNKSGDSSAGAAWPSSSIGSSGHYFDTVARLMAEVADALDYAHRQGVIHRDIKPSNIMVSPDGRLSLNDFGLARMLEQPGMTMTGEFVGTPAYMSPEQIVAGRVPLDHRTDIYSLGATLYELLTTQRPFTGEQRDQILSQILHKEPRPPRRINKKVPVDLETICLKALEKDPDRRYQSAGAMAEDLRRYVNRFAISARRAGTVTRIRKWAKRHPSVAVLSLCLLAALLAAGFFAYETWRAHGRLLAEQRQASLDNAILEAMSGDAQAALAAVAKAENQGVEPGQLNMIRGLVERHRGRSKEALLYLEQAEQQLPDSVAVKALLSDTYMAIGDGRRFEEMYLQVEQLQPRTSEDYYALGHSYAELDPLRAVRTLDGAPARSRQSSVARLIRARAQTRVAMLTGRVADAEEALAELQKVEQTDSALWLVSSVDANLVAARAYGSKDPRGEAALKQASRDVAALSSHRDNPMAVLSRSYFFLVQGDDDALLEEVRQARSRGSIHPYAVPLEASVLYGRMQYDEALTRLRTHKSDDTWFDYQAIILATMPGRKADAERALAESTRESTGGMERSLQVAFWQLLGPEYRPKTQQAALEIRERLSDQIPAARDGWYHKLLAFHAGLMDAKDLRRAAGDSLYNQGEAGFYIGLRELAEGNRTKAKACFTRTLETGVFFYLEYWWSRAFLARIDDPDWLPWLPVSG